MVWKGRFVRSTGRGGGNSNHSAGGILRRTWLALAVGLALVLTSAGTAAATVTAGAGKAVTAAGQLPDGDEPPGFLWGTDSYSVTVPGSAPYRMPFLGGAYGGYIGMTGSWSYWQGCKGGFIAFSSTNAAQAHSNYVTYHTGVGDGSYWFMGGPGVDPHWNGTSAEAHNWGAQQAVRALADVANGANDYPVVFMDIELPGVAPANDNGWKNVYTSPCSGVVKISRVPAAVDRADFNGFYDYIAAHSKFKPGVYSAPAVWNSIFGSTSASPGSPGYIPHTDEWTYEPETTNYAGNAPYGWCLKSGGCAHFFGGVSTSSSNALMWQWSGGGGAVNGIGGFNGDLDQIDASRQN